MSKRIFTHLLFWSLFVLLYAVMKLFFAGPSDLVYPPLQRFGRFVLNELLFLPWKIIPFYVLFYYLIPRFFQRGKFLQTAVYFLAVLMACLYAYRATVGPASLLLYGEAPDFEAYSFERIVYTLTDVIPAIALASTVKLLKGRIEGQQKEQLLQQEKLNSELKFLKAQTNPHFLFNTLNNLYGLARKNDRNTAPSILKLAHIMRFILYECSTPTIPIINEIRIIEDYIELEKLRYDERLSVNFTRRIDWEQQPIAPLILLPFVENAFKHGAGETRFDSFIDIDLRLQGQQLDFRVSNSCEAEQEDPDEGIGLTNVRRQLELTYDKHYHLDIRTEKAIFSIQLTIQLNAHD